jgi:cytochrome c-type biogenesis protein CcmH
MTVFWLSAIVMILIAVAFIVWPLLRHGPLSGLHHDELNLGLARERLQEWQTELDEEAISEAEFDNLRSELEDTLLLELGSEAPIKNKQKPHAYLAIALVVLIPMVVIGLYLQLGTPTALLPDALVDSSTTRQGAALKPSVPPVDVMLAQLQARLAENPDDEYGWSILANAMMSLKRFPEAIQAYESWLQLVGNRSDVLVRYADALAMAADGDFSGRPTGLLEEALAADPFEPQGLWLSGIAARERGDFKQALIYWYRLEPVLVEQPQLLDKLEQMIAQTEAAALANGAAIPNRSKNSITKQPSTSPDSRPALKVRVEIDPKLSPLLSVGDVLFVYARVAGIKPPIAAIRQTILQWPIEVILDDVSSVMHTSPLFSFDAVEISAHVSRSGEAMARTGDFVARAVTSPTDDGAVVQIRISAVLP